MIGHNFLAGQVGYMFGCLVNCMGTSYFAPFHLLIGFALGPEAGAYFNWLGFNDLAFSTADLVVRRLRLLWLCPAVDRRSDGFALEYLGIVWHWAG